MVQGKHNDTSDLLKFKGWQIDDVVQVPNTPIVTLIISHIAAPNKIRLVFTPLVQVGMNGNLTVHLPALNIQSAEMVPEPPK